ncbi:MAG: SprB repeat-containing protein [Flavobacteriales bacterium]|nr:SprB repeat-containing protein [Flavobacteriales bacterium]
MEHGRKYPRRDGLGGRILPRGGYDSDTGSVEGELTLEEPEQLVGTATAFEYPNDFNVSCHSCYNGSIDAGAIGGVAPYTYEWRDGPTVEDRSGLGARDYTVVVHDANGCEAASITLILREPQRNDWTMSGNAGTNPATQYIGTSDNKDVVFKTNATERLRLLASGDVKLDILGWAQALYRDADGIFTLRRVDQRPSLTRNTVRDGV